MRLNYLKKLNYWLLPRVCILCQDSTAQESDLCLACKNELPWIHQACIQCGLPLCQINERCGNCLKQSPSFDKTFALFYYKPPIRQLITQLKFHEKLLPAHLLGGLMAERLASHYSNCAKAEYIIPVPLHRKRLTERGFNQALELARPISHKLKIPLALNICQRTQNTHPQSSITAMDRECNMKNAFSVAQNFSAKHVLIIDDVMTTGNTVSELSFILKAAQVKQVDVCCAARTVKG